MPYGPNPTWPGCGHVPDEAIAMFLRQAVCISERQCPNCPGQRLEREGEFAFCPCCYVGYAISGTVVVLQLERLVELYPPEIRTR